VERVRVSAEQHANLGLDSVALTAPGRILGIALRHCPALPPTIAGRTKDYRRRTWGKDHKVAIAAAYPRR
jgi:hypothetical protein